MKYYLEKKSNLSFDETLTKVEEELKVEGFGILTEIDVQATLKKKLDVDFKKYKILGACNPPSAYKALGLEDKIGVLLPCNVIVEENEGGEVEVAMVNPLVAMESVQSESLAEVAATITEKLSNVLNRI
jgi:uncharacterized protein (DUF302 family)